MTDRRTSGVAWSRAARNDLQAIEDHWIAERPDYVAAVLRAAEGASLMLADRPGLGAPLVGVGLRKYRLGTTPYLLLYELVEGAVRIVRVRHDREDWRGPA